MAREEPTSTAVIDGVTYSVESWRVEQQGRILEQVWDRGWSGGLGAFRRERSDTYYYGRNIDCSSPPFLRLPPSYTKITDATLSSNKPFYLLTAQDGASVNYIFVLQGRYAFKFDADDTYAYESTKDFGASAICGRPALFEGSWYVPLGDSVDAVKLTTVAAGAAADTWDDMAGPIKALHFAVGEDQGTSYLCRAYNTNQITKSSDASAWGSDFEVGDSSLEIRDLHSWKGELAVSKPDSVYMWDLQGNAHPILQAGERNQNPSSHVGKMSLSYGQYYYWTPLKAIWRFYGGAGNPIDPTAAKTWLGVALEGTVPFNEVSGSVAAWGRWLYATHNGDDTIFGWITDSGEVEWQGALYWTNSQAADFLAIVFVPGATAPVLVLYSYTDFYFIQLHSDGSPRTALGSNRGTASTTSYLWMPNIDFGLPGRQKQLRRMWATVEGAGSDQPITLGVYRDGAGTFAGIGSDITSDGTTEVAWTAGSNDLAYEVMPAIKIVTGAGYTPATSDPRVRVFGIQAVSPQIIRARIPLTVEGIASGSSIPTQHRNLLNLQNGPRVSITEPSEGGGTPDTYNGRIIFVSDAVTHGGTKRGAGWLVDVLIERYDLGS